MNPLDRPRIRQLVEGHRRRGEDPWVIVGALYQKLSEAPSPGPSCVWEDWEPDPEYGHPRMMECRNRSRGNDVFCGDELAYTILDTHDHANLRLCHQHWLLLEDRLRVFMRKLYEDERRQKNRTRDRRAAVYFMRRSDGQIKIGFSSDPVRRQGQLEEIHGPLEILRTELGGRNREAQLHRLYADARTEGEWFQPVPALLSYIETGTPPEGDPNRYVPRRRKRKTIGVE